MTTGWTPASSHAVDLQSVHLLGSHAYELYPAVDCPTDAFYMDAVHYVDNKPVIYRRSACVFERPGATPLRRRRRRDPHGPRDQADQSQPRVDGLPDNVLVVRTVIVIDSYDYIIDILFHQNAVVEAVCSVSGSLKTYYYSSHIDDYGYQVVSSLPRGSVTQHTVVAIQHTTQLRDHSSVPRYLRRIQSLFCKS